MNERIKQLAETAYRDVVCNHTIGDTVSREVVDQKFAELIVRECVGIVNKIVPPGYEDYPDYRDQIEQSFRSECVAEIKQHFGLNDVE